MYHCGIDQPVYIGKIINVDWLIESIIDVCKCLIGVKRFTIYFVRQI